MRTTRRRYWFELGLAVLAGALAVLTLINHEWIEVVFRVDPDQGSGALEWGIVFAMAAIALVSGLAARAERRRLATSRPDAARRSRLVTAGRRPPS